MSSSEYDEIAKGMEEAQAELERAALEDEIPNKARQTERARALKKLADSLARLRELERRRTVDSELAGALTQMNKSTKQLLAAINANTKTTNDLLAISNARLAQLEQEIVSRRRYGVPGRSPADRGGRIPEGPARRTAGHRRPEAAVQRRDPRGGHARTRRALLLGVHEVRGRIGRVTVPLSISTTQPTTSDKER